MSATARPVARSWLAYVAVAAGTLALGPALGPARVGLLAAQVPAEREDAPVRAALRRRVTERIERVLQLDPEQRERFWAANRRYTQQRLALQSRERQLRSNLRTQLLAATPDQQRIGELIDAFLQLHRERLALVEAEQRELKGFLTPAQRARYLALQEQWRRRIDDLRGHRDSARRGAMRRGDAPF